MSDPSPAPFSSASRIVSDSRAAAFLKRHDESIQLGKADAPQTERARDFLTRIIHWRYVSIAIEGASALIGASCKPVGAFRRCQRCS